MARSQLGFICKFLWGGAVKVKFYHNKNGYWNVHYYENNNLKSSRYFIDDEEKNRIEKDFDDNIIF